MSKERLICDYKGCDQMAIKNGFVETRIQKIEVNTCSKHKWSALQNPSKFIKGGAR